jgi:Rod binding domain-containing protein
MLPIDPNSSAMASLGASGVANPAKTANSNTVDSPDQQKLKKAAGDFESILLSSLWKSMKQSFNDPKDSDADPAHGMIDDWGIEVMSGAVGKAGGLGIGNMIIKHLGHDSSSQTVETHAADANVFGTLADKKL